MKRDILAFWRELQSRMDIQVKPGKVAQFLLVLSVCPILAGIAGKLVETRQGTLGLFSSDSSQELGFVQK